jgi:hypothetical protein
VVPKMVRAPKKVTLSAARRAIGPAARPGWENAATPEQSGPNLYNASSAPFLKSSGFKLCLGVLVAAVLVVPVWKHAARPSTMEVETAIGSGDWTRQSTVLGDPGVKQSRQLILYRPALNAVDCRLEFNWTVDPNGVGWVFRAKDLGNYYAVRLKVLKLGATPTLALEYFSVYQFVESRHTEKVLVFSRNDPVLRVRMDVFGPSFTLYLQGNATEYWTDARLATGAVGFFEEWNQTPEIHTVRLTFPPRAWLDRKLSHPSGPELLAATRPRSGGV